MSPIPKQDLNSLQKKIVEYQENHSKQIFNQISQSISPYIQNFPRFAFHQKDEDALSEFYLFVLPKLRKIIDAYDSQKASLITFLSKVLKNFWISFLRTQSSAKKKDVVIPTPISFEDKLSDPQPVEENPHNFSNWVKIEIENLNDSTKQMILKLYFFEIFTEEDLPILKKTSKKEYRHCLIFLEELLSELSQKRKKQSFFEERLLNLQRKIFLLQDNPTKIKQLENLKNVYLQRHYSIRTHPNLNLITNFLEIERKNITNTVYNFKKISKRGFRGNSLKLESLYNWVNNDEVRAKEDFVLLKSYKAMQEIEQAFQSPTTSCSISIETENLTILKGLDIFIFPKPLLTRNSSSFSCPPQLILETKIFHIQYFDVQKVVLIPRKVNTIFEIIFFQNKISTESIFLTKGSYIIRNSLDQVFLEIC